MILLTTKTASDVSGTSTTISAMVEENWGKGTGLDSLMSILNRDMEAKGIVLPELSCWTATELPPPELAKHRRKSGGRAPGVQSLPPPCLLLRTAAEAGGFSFATFSCGVGY